LGAKFVIITSYCLGDYIRKYERDVTGSMRENANWIQYSGFRTSGKDRLVDLDVDGTIILKPVLNK